MKVTCADCGKTWTGLDRQHCPSSGWARFPAWPSALPGPDRDAPALQEPPHSGRVGTELFSNDLRAQARAVETLGLVAINPLRSPRRLLPAAPLSMFSKMLLGGQYTKVARVVIGSVAVDVMDVLATFRAGDDAVLVCLDVPVVGLPTKPDIALPRDVTARDTGRWFLIGSQHPDWFQVAPDAGSLASVTPPPLPSGTGHEGLAVDAENVHALILQWWCHRTFNSAAAGDKHRTGNHGVTEGPDARHCRTPMEMLDKGMWRDDAGVWYGARDTRRHAPRGAPEKSLSAEHGEAVQR